MEGYPTHLILYMLLVVACQLAMHQCTAADRECRTELCSKYCTGCQIIRGSTACSKP
jgi:hypothetical protein